MNAPTYLIKSAMGVQRLGRQMAAGAPDDQTGAGALKQMIRQIMARSPQQGLQRGGASAQAMGGLPPSRADLPDMALARQRIQGGARTGGDIFAA